MEQTHVYHHIPDLDKIEKQIDLNESNRLM